MTDYPRLIFEEIAPGQEFHAAWVAISQTRGPGTMLHTHDFYEMMYVLEGAGTHRINDELHALNAGDLIYIRPDDAHAIRVSAGEKLFFINIAFTAEIWRSFLAFANLETAMAALHAAGMPPTIRVPTEFRAELGMTFDRILRAFHESPSRLDLCRFWTAVVPVLLRPETPERQSGKHLPDWLATACRAMRDTENMSVGLPRFIELSTVSPAHLARTLKAHYEQTPTEFVNQLRLQRAAMLLTTTSQEIIDISTDCGFENLSYFYRLFRGYFGKSPRAFRVSARYVVLP